MLKSNKFARFYTKRHMDDKKSLYESPEIQVFVVNVEARILNASLEGSRNGYGTAIEENWD